MYQRVMVPLDGSELAECVLPHVEAIAGGCGVADVVFVRAVEPVYIPSGADWVVSDEEKKRMEADHRAAAEDYLRQLVSRLGYKAQGEVITGRAAESLAEYAGKNDVDLIVIATHGRSGISRWVWGGTADRILRSACVPVFMVRAPGCIPGI